MKTAKTPTRASANAESQLKSFIEKFEPKHRRLIREIRKAMRQRLPTANELVYDNYNFFVIGYCPSERPSDAFVSIAAAANGVSLMFLRGAGLLDPHKLLQGTGKLNRSLKIKSATYLDRREVRLLISEAAAQAELPLIAAGKPKLIIRSVSKKQRPRKRTTA